MGGQLPGTTCGHQLGEDWCDRDTRCQTRSSPFVTLGKNATSLDAKRRQRAMALNAPNARDLVQRTLPFVLQQMTEAQLEQMQRVLNAAVINLEVRAEAERLYSQSVTVRSGQVLLRDQAIVNRADQVMRRAVPVSSLDRRIRLDFTKLVTADAFLPRTDNPDEGTFLEKIRAILVSQGVWLRFEDQFVKDSQDPSRHVLGGRSFQVWLSVGPSGDRIQTPTGQLNREALLGTTLFGAEYYQRVDLGPVQTALAQEVRRLTVEIQSGLEQHQELAKIRRNAVVGVAEVSDQLGGTHFPDQAMWEQPHRFVLRAMELKAGGRIKGSQAFLVTAAILTRNAANLLEEYIEQSSIGAEKAVLLLKVAKTAGHVAEACLIVTGVAGVVRTSTTVATGAAAEGSVDAVAKRVVEKYVAENPEIASDLANVRWVPGPKGSIGGGVKPGSSSGAGTGWHKW